MLEPRLTSADAARELEKMFGSAFCDFGDPSSGQNVRRGNWQPWTTAPASAQENTQREQRIVDVTLRDVLAGVHRAARTGPWLTLGDHLRARDDWWTVAGALETALTAAAAVTDHRTRGYFWSSMLAAASVCMRNTAAPTAAQIAAIAVAPPRRVLATADPRPDVGMFGRVLYPRQGMPNVIVEMAVPAAVSLASDQIAAALAATSLPPNEARLVLQCVGITICPDLWRHPAAVKFLLIPAVRTLRREYGAIFSLDGNPRGTLLEALIQAELGDKWVKWRGRGGCW
ncbi:hypothetical protein ACXPWS_16505 [Mycobacterium sp. BMJ-28]